MKKIAIILSLLAAVVSASAQTSSSFSGDLVGVLAAPEPRTVPLFLKVPADYVSVPIRITSDERNAALAYDETRASIQLIAQRIKDGGQFRMTLGAVSLARHESGSGFSSGSWNQPSAAAEVFLLAPFSKDRDNIFTAGADAARFVEALTLPGRARCELGQLQLAVENPEQDRDKLLGQIAEEIRKTRAAVAPDGAVKVHGLESSVMVRQADERNVELFLNYTLSITTGK